MFIESSRSWFKNSLRSILVQKTLLLKTCLHLVTYFTQKRSLLRLLRNLLKHCLLILYVAVKRNNLAGWRTKEVFKHRSCIERTDVEKLADETKFAQENEVSHIKTRLLLLRWYRIPFRTINNATRRGQHYDKYSFIRTQVPYFIHELKFYKFFYSFFLAKKWIILTTNEIENIFLYYEDLFWLRHFFFIFENVG